MSTDPGTINKNALRRIAAGRAARTPVDSQGHPTGPAATYVYDEDGLLVEATPGSDE